MAAPKPEKAAPLARKADEKPRNKRTPRKIHNLPPQLRRQLDRKLGTGRFKSFRALADWLGKHGHYISPSALHRYSLDFDSLLLALRISTAQAEDVARLAGVNTKKVEKALLKILQSRLFHVMVQVNKAALTQQPGQVHAAVRSYSRLEETNIHKRKLAMDEAKFRDAKAAKAGAKLDAVRGRGLSVEGAAQIRAALMETIE